MSQLTIHIHNACSATIKALKLFDFALQMGSTKILTINTS